MLSTEKTLRGNLLVETTLSNRHAIHWLLAGVLLLLLSSSLAASDHADPVDFTRKKPLEPVITDLFVFPVDAKGMVVKPFDAGNIPLHPGKLEKRKELCYDDRKTIKSLMLILCVRRALTETKSLNLEPFTYRLHMDTASAISFDDTDMATHAQGSQGVGYSQAGATKRRELSPGEALARYGGLIARPDKIDDDVMIELSLHNDAKLKSFQTKGLEHTEYDNSGVWTPDVISIRTGVFDDPFIFPTFFGSNVVAMVVSIPIQYFKGEQMDWLVWATSHKNKMQIDHVGRSLRTQNPRFDLLNTLHPSKHVAAIRAEDSDPSLMRDLGLRFNLQQLFAYRDWDFVPDVMIYSNRFQVGYPNGRVLKDDVAAFLAQHGDTLLLELSHQNKSQWPRHTENDRPFSETFPYLAEPFADKPPAKPYQLSMKNTFILWVIGIAIVVIVLLAIAQVVHLIRWWLGIRCRRRPL